MAIADVGARHMLRALAIVTVLLAGCDEGEDCAAKLRRQLDAGAARFDLPFMHTAETVHLSELCLYEDFSEKRLSADLVAYTPVHELWSDGAKKQRWVRFLSNETIDTSDMDHWQFPVGTMVFKEFSRDGKRLETRVLVRTGPSPDDTWMGSFAWNEGEQDAVLMPDGATDVRGTDHDVPAQKACFTCHDGEPGRVLGLSAVQLRTPSLLSLSHPPAQAYRTPGDEVTAAALGYMHANCGHCHNPHGSARPDTDMNLRLLVADTEPEATPTYRTTIAKQVSDRSLTTAGFRITAGFPEQSALLERMSRRGTKTQMPTLGTEHADALGIETVRAWIARMPI